MSQSGAERISWKFYEDLKTFFSGDKTINLGYVIESSNPEVEIVEEPVVEKTRKATKAQMMQIEEQKLEKLEELVELKKRMNFNNYYLIF